MLHWQHGYAEFPLTDGDVNEYTGTESDRIPFRLTRFTTINTVHDDYASGVIYIVNIMIVPPIPSPDPSEDLCEV
jgi:hypothetical protein